MTEQLEPLQQAVGIIDPDYARIYTQARIVAWQHGYACLAHGSFTRDLDLLLVPWTDRAGSATLDHIIKHIARATSTTVNGPPKDKPHGRKAWTLLLSTGPDPRWVDLSAFVGDADQGDIVAWGQPDAAGNIVDTITALDKTGEMKAWEAQYSIPLYKTRKTLTHTEEPKHE